MTSTGFVNVIQVVFTLPSKDGSFNKETVSLTVIIQATEQNNINLAQHLNHPVLMQSANLIMAEDTRQDKRASFSAITEHNRNGMARTSAVASSKTGASKKLVIKNFKGTDADHLYVLYSVCSISTYSNTRV